jgi:hypothetical protein
MDIEAAAKRVGKTVQPPGVYAGVPGEEYANWFGLSQSAANKFFETPRRGRDYMLGEREPPTWQMRLGTVFHTRMLEREAWERRHVVEKINPQAYPATWLKAEDEARKERGTDGPIMLSCPDWDARHREMLQSVYEHPTASKLAERVTRHELSILWHDEAIGVPCKARIDIVTPRACGDLKTINKIEWDNAERHILNYGYHRQAALTLRGAAHLGLPTEWFWLFVENATPFEVAVWTCAEDDIEQGFAECVIAANRWRAWCERGEAPVHQPAPAEIGLPRWAKNEYMRAPCEVRQVSQETRDAPEMGPPEAG